MLCCHHNRRRYHHGPAFVHSLCSSRWKHNCQAEVVIAVVVDDVVVVVVDVVDFDVDMISFFDVLL